MAREGFPFLIIALIGAVLSGITALTTSVFAIYVLSGSFLFFALFVAFFFRDPERKMEAGTDDIVSPGDGKVVAVVEEEDSLYFKAKIQRVSIFLSIFDVHINRIPYPGKIDFFNYQEGKFKAAFVEDASSVNEQTQIGIVNNKRRVMFKQIAGLIARRIVCTVEEGNDVLAGERCGLIKFGSRIDVLLPLDVNIRVQKGNRVVGGKTIIGTFTHEK